MLDIYDYFTQLKVFLDDLENYLTIPPCSCVIAISCGLLLILSNDIENLIRFLKALSEKLSHSKFQMMMMNHLLDIDRVFSLVIQQ